jgi:predicted transcriptional regulator
METICDVLQVISAGAEKPTHIMYKANLSWPVMQHYIKSLESQGLIIMSSDEGKSSYRLSSKGFQLLCQFRRIREDLNLSR